MKNMTKRTIFLLLLTALLATGAAAQEEQYNKAARIQEREEILAALSAETGQDDSARLFRGILYHNLAETQREESADEEVLEKALQEITKEVAERNPVGRAYRGSLITLQASVQEQKGNLFGAAALLQKGFTEMDSAVREAPDVFLIRFLRGINSIEVSQGSPFDRYDKAEEDLQWLLAHLPENLLPGDAAAVYWMKGEIAYRNDRLEEALSAWEEAYETAPESYYGQKSDERLWDLEE